RRAADRAARLGLRRPGAAGRAGGGDHRSPGVRARALSRCAGLPCTGAADAPALPMLGLPPLGAATVAAQMRPRRWHRAVARALKTHAANMRCGPYTLQATAVPGSRSIR